MRREPCVLLASVLDDDVFVAEAPPGEGTGLSPHMFKRTTIVALVAVAIWSHAPVFDTVSIAGGVDWATGVAVHEKLVQPINILWSGSPLRNAVENLSHAQRVAILIDRRVDPGQKLDLTIRAQPMEAVLAAIADHCGLGVSQLGNVIYLGPRPVAQRLQAIAAALEKAVRQLPRPAQRKFLDLRPIAWPDLATPRDLLAQLARQNGITIAGLDQVPYDLWAAADLPPLSLIDRLTLIAVQFDLTFKVLGGGTRLESVRIPEDLPVAADGLHRLPAASPASARPNTAVEDIRINRLVIQNKPLGPVLRQLALRWGWSFTWMRQPLRGPASRSTTRLRSK